MTIFIIVVLVAAIGAAVYYFAHKSKTIPMGDRAAAIVVAAPGDSPSPTDIISEAAKTAINTAVARDIIAARTPALPTLSG